MDYGEYLNSYDWYRAKKNMRLRKGCSCSVCGRKEGINIHHLHYNDRNGSILGRERPNDLMPLCEKHHHIAHMFLDELFNDKDVLFQCGEYDSFDEVYVIIDCLIAIKAEKYFSCVTNWQTRDYPNIPSYVYELVEGKFIDWKYETCVGCTG